MRWTLIVLAACGSSAKTAPDATGIDDAPPDTPASCTRAPRAADRVRHVVISHPFDAAGAKANAWEVLDLSATGELSRPGHAFMMGRAFDGELAFTADGEIGVAAQEDGTVGVFRIDDAGMPAVIVPALHGSFYASRVVGAGDHVYVLDDQWRENGGGIYRIDIACDGTPTDRGLVVASKLPGGLAFIPGTDKAMLAATDIATSPAGADAHLLTWAEPPSVMASTDAFGDDMAIVAGSTLTADGGFFLIGDNSQFSNVANRVSVIPVQGDHLGTPAVIPNVMDPMALVASPFAPTVLVASGFGNAFYKIDRDAGGAFRLAGEVTYAGAKPELPGGAVMIAVGALRGLVLVSENSGVRRVAFGSDGGITDRGRFPTGDGLDQIVGAIGVQP